MYRLTHFSPITTKLRLWVYVLAKDNQHEQYTTVMSVTTETYLYHVIEIGRLDTTS
jgi:hypothetical protein